MLTRREIAPVQEFDGKLCMIPHLLHGLRRPLPMKGGPHDWMPVDHLPPNCRDSIWIDRFVERYYDLLDVNAKIRPAQAMKTMPA